MTETDGVGVHEWWYKVRNSCFACKQPIQLQDLIDQVNEAIQLGSLKRLHIHYCGQCAKLCKGPCGEVKPVWSFKYDQESPAYLEWRERGMRGFPGPREAYSDLCAWCEREEIKVKEARKKEDFEQQRREFLASPETKSLLELMGYGGKR